MINSSNGKDTNRPTRLHRKCIVLLSVSLGGSKLRSVLLPGDIS